MLLKCPYCKKTGCVDKTITSHIKSYPVGIFSIPCVHCEKRIFVVTSHRGGVESVSKYTSKLKKTIAKQTREWKKAKALALA